MRLLTSEIGEAADHPRQIERVGAIARLFEAFGIQIDEDPNPKRKQPGLSTELPLQFVSNSRD